MPTAPYTSLVRLKMALSGALPPMTRLPESIVNTIDPALTINGNGWGGVVEDSDKGLLCCVRGCGEYHHNLTLHLDHSHKEIGGAVGFKALMSIPSSAKLASQSSIDRALTTKELRHGPSTRPARKRVNQPGFSAKSSANTIGFQNFRDSCPAQLQVKMIACHQTLGRVPSPAEFNEFIGRKADKAITRVFGSWESAILQSGLGDAKYYVSREGVLLALVMWRRRHGRFPSVADVTRRDQLPVLPPHRSILRALKQYDWPTVLRMADLRFEELERKRSERGTKGWVGEKSGRYGR